MAEGDVTFYNNFKEQLLIDGIGNMTTQTLRVTLHTGYTPNIDTHQVWSDVSSTEYGTGSGYTADGQALSSVAVTQNNTADQAELDAADLTWSSLGALSPATPSHAIVRVDNSTDPLVCYIELGTTATNGGDYTLQFNSTGLISLS